MSFDFRMNSGRSNAPTPSSRADSPSWGRVGIIAAVGFALGIAWPRALGVRFGPSAPAEAGPVATTTTTSAALSGDPNPSIRSDAGVSNAAMSASVVGKRAGADAPVNPPGVKLVENANSLNSKAHANSNANSSYVLDSSQANLRIHVSKGILLSCKTASGDTRKSRECGSSSSVDARVVPVLRQLTTCPALASQSGKLSVVTTVSAPEGALRWSLGKSTTLARVDDVAACLKERLATIAVDGVPADYDRVTVAYSVSVRTLSSREHAGDAGF